jgi:hypothetical protein
MRGVEARTVEPAMRRGQRLRPPLPVLLVSGIVVAFVALIVLSAATRSRADAFLHLFRTTRREPLAIIDVTLPQTPGIDTRAVADAFDLDVPTGIEVATSHQAQDRVDFNVRTLRRPQAPRVHVFLDQPVNVTIDRAALERAIAGAAGPGVRLPRELDAPVVAQVPAGVRQVWTDPSGDITLWILRNPRFYTTSGPTWEELRGRLIQLAVLIAPETARTLQAVTDWDNTLVVPVPPDARASRVRADNTEDALLIEEDGRSRLIWQRYGVLHILEARMPGRALVRLADSLR